MPQMIQIPGVGEVEFPDSMDDSQIELAAGRLASESIQRPQPFVSTTAGGPRTRVASLGELATFLGGEAREEYQQMQEPLPLPEPSQRYIQENPLLGSFLQRLSRIAGGIASPATIASLPAFAIPYVGPALALGLGTKGLASAFGEISTLRPENVGGGLADIPINALILGGGIAGARRPIFEATPEGRLVAELARESNFGEPQAPVPQRRLGTSLANVLQDPNLKPLIEELLRETTPTGRIIQPGRGRALSVLQELAYPEEHVTPPGQPLVEGFVPTMEAERPGGGPAQFGKVSYAAEAPTLLRNVPQPERTLSEQERLMQQSFVPAKGTAAFEAQKGENAPRIRSYQGPVREERLPIEGGEEARGENIQREQTGKERPGVSGKEGALSGEATKGVQPGGTEKVGEPTQKVPRITIPEPGKTGREAGAFFLPGPELIRTLSGFKRTATVAGQQLFNRVRNLVHPDEMRAYEDSGLRVFLSRPRSPDEVAKWMEENGPRVETKVFESGGLTKERAQTERAEIAHKLDTIVGPEWRNAPREDFTGDAAKLRDRYLELSNATTRRGLDPDQWRGIASKDAPQKMVVVRVPLKGSELAKEASMIVGQPNNPGLQDARRESGLLHRGGHLGSEDINVLGWARGHDDVVGGKQTTVLDEVQKDWGQPYDTGIEGKWRFRGQENTKYKDTVFSSQAEARKAGDESHPLLKDWQRLTLKAQIEQSLKEGKEAIVVPDAETAMMSEGHDLELRSYIDPTSENIATAQKYQHIPRSAEVLKKLRAGESVDAGTTAPYARSEEHTTRDMADRAGFKLSERPSQDAGMRLNYDRILPKIMEELTGVKGEPVVLDPHQRAMAGYGSEDWRNALQGRTMEEMREEFRETGGVPRSDLIFETSPGIKKINASGLMYDLSKVKQRTEPFKLFGSDKLSEKVGGIKIPEPGTKGSEAGAFVLPPILKKIVDKLTPEKGKLLTDAEVEYGTKGPVIMFRSAATEEKIATSPQGIGRIPGLGQIFDPRATAKDPVMRAILTGQSMMFKAKQISTLFLEATKIKPRAFLEDSTGQATLANGTKLPTSDVIRREIANLGSQPLTADQREFINMWRVLRKGLVDYARSEGVKKVIDDQGSTVNLSKYSFPTASYYDAETGKILREPDAYVRVSKFMEAIYSAIAAQRLANHPALQGRPASSGPATLAEGGSFVPWARGRIFPKEIADEINRYYGAQPHSFARQLTSANDFLKSVKYTMDVSAPFNQGLLMMTRFPLRWVHAAVRSYIALADTKQFSRYLQPRMEDAVEFVTHGGSLGSLQDFLIGAQKGALASRIPGVKQTIYPLIRRSAESMNTFLSMAKLEMYRAWKQSVEVKDLPKLVEAIENASLSGRMEAIGLTPARNLAERLLFNAPSYIRGAANLIAAIPQGGPQGMVARQSLATLAGGLSLTMLAIYKGANFTDDQIKERFDPGSSKFLRYPTKLANGDVLEVGAGNIVIQIARLLGNTFDVASGKKPSGSGVEGNPILRWLSYRGSPLVQLAAQVYTGKDYLWRDISAKEAAARSVLPISVEQFWGREKPGTKAVEAGTSFLGMSSYPENYTATRERLQSETANQLFRKAYEGLNPRERAKVTDAIKPQMDVKREETGPPSLAYIEKMDKARQERMTGALSDVQRSFLERNKLKLPGYRLQDTVRGAEVHFTKAEEEKYEGFLVEEYKKAVDRLLVNPDFEGLSQKFKDVRFERVTANARERAKILLRREIRAVH